MGDKAPAADDLFNHAVACFTSTHCDDGRVPVPRILQRLAASGDAPNFLGCLDTAYVCVRASLSEYRSGCAHPPGPITEPNHSSQIEFIPETWGDRNSTKCTLALVKLFEKCIERFSRHSALVETLRHQSERLQQHIRIDIRGQHTSQEQLEKVARRIVERSNGLLRREHIKFRAED